MEITFKYKLFIRIFLLLGSTNVYGEMDSTTAYEDYKYLMLKKYEPQSLSCNGNSCSSYGITLKGFNSIQSQKIHSALSNLYFMRSFNPGLGSDSSPIDYVKSGINTIINDGGPTRHYVGQHLTATYGSWLNTEHPTYVAAVLAHEAGHEHVGPHAPDGKDANGGGAHSIGGMIALRSSLNPHLALSQRNSLRNYAWQRFHAVQNVNDIKILKNYFHSVSNIPMDKDSGCANRIWSCSHKDIKFTMRCNNEGYPTTTIEWRNDYPNGVQWAVGQNKYTLNCSHGSPSYIKMFWVPRAFGHDGYSQASSNIGSLGGSFCNQSLREIPAFSSKVFDPHRYAANYPDLNIFNNNSIALADHWLHRGIKEGRVGSLIFSAKEYLQMYPQVSNSSSNEVKFNQAITHFVTLGSVNREVAGRIALRSQVFNPNHYLSSNADLKEILEDLKISALSKLNYLTTHWLYHGRYEGRQGSLTFDSREYLIMYPEIRHVPGVNSFANAIDDYVLYGTSERKTGVFELHPSVFNIDIYRNRNADIKNETPNNLLIHWLKYGVKEGRVASNGFSSMAYLALYPDVRETYGVKNYAGALHHYVVHGIAEGRRGQ